MTAIGPGLFRQQVSFVEFAVGGGVDIPAALPAGGRPASTAAPASRGLRAPAHCHRSAPAAQSAGRGSSVEHLKAGSALRLRVAGQPLMVKTGCTQPPGDQRRGWLRA